MTTQLDNTKHRDHAVDHAVVTTKKCGHAVRHAVIKEQKLHHAVDHAVRKRKKHTAQLGTQLIPIL